MMKLKPLACALLLSWGISDAVFGQSVLFRPYQTKPGEVIVFRSSSDASGGKISVVDGSRVQKGSSSIKRQRTFERRVSGAGPTEKLEYVVMLDQTQREMRLGEKHDHSTQAGELIGQVVQGVRDGAGRWRLLLKGREATTQQALELSELEAYENRRMFQDVPVKLGQSWFMEPSFIRNFIERDIGPSLIEAKMTFKAIEMIDGERTAVLPFTVKSQARNDAGTRFRSSSVLLDMHGTLYVSLNSMLDKKLTASGTMTSTVRQAGTSTVVKSPLTFVVSKTVVRRAGGPPPK